MHEMGITQNIVSIVLEKAKESNAKKVTEVNLEIGALTQIVPDCIEFYFEIMTKDTIAQGAKLNIHDMPTKAKCLQCGNVFETPELDLTCPKCGNLFSQITGGKELAVTSIDVD